MMRIFFAAGLIICAMLIPAVSFSQEKLSGEILLGKLYYQNGFNAAARKIDFEVPVRLKSISFMHQTDGVIASAERKEGKKVITEIIEFDLHGRKRQVLYRSDTISVVYGPYISWNDSLIVFLADGAAMTADGFPEFAFTVNLPTGNTKVISLHGLSSIDYSPWIHGRNQFIYQSFFFGKKLGSGEVLLYLCDAMTGTLQKLDSDVGAAVASPTEPVIAYTRAEQSSFDVWLHDLRTDEKRNLYTSSVILSDIRWSPDGRSILLSSGVAKNKKLLIGLDKTVRELKRIPSTRISWR